MKFILRNIFVILMFIVTSMYSKAQMSQHILQSRAYSELYIKGLPDVECRQNADSAGMIVFSCEPSVFNAVKCNNVGERLQISVDKSMVTNVRRSFSKVVIYYTGKLSVISYTGAGNIVVDNIPTIRDMAVLLTGSGQMKLPELNVKRLSCSVAGSGKMSFRGKTIAENATCCISGSGAIEISDIESKSTNATVNGPGDLVINGRSTKVSFAVKGSGAIDASSLGCSELEAGAYGSGKIYYNHSVGKVNLSGKTSNIIVR